MAARFFRKLEKATRFVMGMKGWKNVIVKEYDFGVCGNPRLQYYIEADGKFLYTDGYFK